MEVKPVLRRVCAARAVAACIALVVLSGCFGGYQLVSVGSAENVSGWHQYVTPRPPVNQIENSVIQVARTGKNEKTSDFEILFIINDRSKAAPVQVVDVVSISVSDEQFPEKTVTRYRILDGKIAAMSDPVTEFYVNANFERAILRAIALTWASDRVLIYDDGVRSLSIVSYAINKCTADVRIYKEGSTGGIPLAEKRVAFCFVR